MTIDVLQADLRHVLVLRWEYVPFRHKMRYRANYEVIEVVGDGVKKHRHPWVECISNRLRSIGQIF